MRTITLPVILGVLTTTAALALAGEPERHEGTIEIGTGTLQLQERIDHYRFLAPGWPLGFDLDGDVRYAYRTYEVCIPEIDCRPQVRIFAPAGERDVDFALEWVWAGEPDVVIDYRTGHGTDCENTLCR